MDDFGPSTYNETGERASLRRPVVEDATGPPRPMSPRWPDDFPGDRPFSTLQQTVAKSRATGTFRLCNRLLLSPMGSTVRRPCPSRPGNKARRGCHALQELAILGGRRRDLELGHIHPLKEDRPRAS